MSGVLLTFGPTIYESILANPKKLPKWDFGLMAEVRHSVATIAWDEPLPPEPLDSYNDDHNLAVGSIGRYITEDVWARGMNPIVVAGTCYTDWRALQAATIPREPALIADRDQLVCALRDGHLHGVVLAHLLTIAAARRMPGRRAG